MQMLVTGGSGFLGAGLVRELLAQGHAVRVLDDHSRGRPHRLADLGERLQVVHGDVRDAAAVRAATEGCEVVWHLAYVNGTRYFYEKPDVVLDVGIKGALNTVEAALDAGARRYVLASTSETYNEPTHVPTTEAERLMIPDITNPRFSYGGQDRVRLLALHLGGHRGLETVIFRPHNIYGPDMGFEHVIPRSSAASSTSPMASAATASPSPSRAMAARRGPSATSTTAPAGPASPASTASPAASTTSAPSTR
ncbi:MAG: NAD-dependent epimerase/dehydratase family protein [bacterium]